MSQTLFIMANEIIATLRRKTFVLFAFGVPLVLGVIVVAAIVINRDAGADVVEAAAAAQQARQQQVGFVDPAGLIRALPADAVEELLTEFDDEARARAALEADEVAGYYLVPANYPETGALTYVTGDYSPLSGNVDSGWIEWALFANLYQGDAEQAARVWQPLDLTVTSLAPPVPDGEDSWIVEMLPTLMVLILYMAILLPAGVLVNSLTDEKKNRVLEILLTSVSPRQMIVGKIMGVGVLGIIQTALYIGVLLLVVNAGGQPLNIPPGFSLPWSLLGWSILYMLLGYAMYAALLAGVGALAPELKESRSASLVVMSPLIVAYMFNVAVLINPDGGLAIVSSLFPLTAPINMIGRMATTTVPTWQTVLAALLMLLAAIAIVLLTSRMFQAQVLLSGQPFSTRRYFQVLLSRA